MFGASSKYGTFYHAARVQLDDSGRCDGSIY